MHYKVPDLLKLIEKSEPFSVRGEGDFWQFVKTDERNILYAELLAIPPHYHKKTEETISIIKGSGVIEYEPDYFKAEKSYHYTDFWDREKAVKIKIVPGMTFKIRRHTPHRMVIDPDCKYIGAFLFYHPPFDSNDEFKLEVWDKIDSPQKV